MQQLWQRLTFPATITNITLTYSLFEGITISWWYKALREGTSLGDLHRVWAFGNSFMSAIWAGRFLNVTAVACILVAIAPLNGPFLQRATTLMNTTASAAQDFDLRINHLVPKKYSGIISGRGHAVNMLSSSFSPIAREYYARSPINYTSECTGTCTTNVIAAGFHVNCSSYGKPYNIYEHGVGNGTTIFGADVGFDVGGDPTLMTLGVVYQPEQGCNGTLSVTNCTLLAGTVKYPVVLNGAGSTIALASGSSIWDDVTVGTPDSLPSEDLYQVGSTYGGIFLALQNQYTSNLQLAFGGGINLEFLGTASQSSLAYAHDGEDYQDCGIYFTDPLEDFLQGCRELIFRAAVASSNSSTPIQHVQASGSGLYTAYHTDKVFLALATLVSLLAIIAVFLTFFGFWRIGRVVSMSPLEIAKAFNAPMLREGDSNATAKQLVSEVGKKPVRYGIMGAASTGAISPTPDSGSIYRDSSPYGRKIPDAVASPNLLRRPFTYRNTSEGDFELLTPQQGAPSGSSRLELADPKRVAPL
jgi:hypothetical protein